MGIYWEWKIPLKGTSGMDKFCSVIDRMGMKLGSKFSNSLRIKAQLLKRLQRVIVVDSATHFQKDGACREWRRLLEGWSRGLFAALSWFCNLVSSQYLTSIRWMSRWRMLRSLGRCWMSYLQMLYCFHPLIFHQPGTQSLMWFFCCLLSFLYTWRRFSLCPWPDGKISLRFV